MKTQAVHDAWAAPERILELRININGQTYTATDVISLTYDSGAMNGDAFALGSTYANSIKITFSHIVEGLELLNEVTPEIGIQLPDGSWDYTKLGVFVIDSEVNQDRNNSKTSLSATDRMVMIGSSYESKLTYPASLIDITTEVANIASVKLNEADIARLPSIKVSAFPKGTTLRQVIGYVAQFAGGFATFDRDGLLDIRGLQDPNFIVSADNYVSKGLNKNETFYRIGGMQAEVTQSSKDDSGNDVNNTINLQVGSSAGSQIKLTNPAMTQDELEDLYQQFRNINFYPYSLNWYADPSLEAGDWVTIEDNKGNEFKSPALGLTLNFSGGLTGSLKADTTVSASTSFVYQGELNQKVTQLGGSQNASGNRTWEGIDQPQLAKEGDIWFKKEGPDTYLMIYHVDPDTGVGDWIEQVSTKSANVIQQINDDMTDARIIGEKLHITGTTLIDNVAIKSGAIAGLSADKITAGTINAATVNLINLNANNISTGTIIGASLSINLNTGMVEFQRGRIHNTSNTIDINIDQGYMSVANGNNRVMLKNGEMQFVEPNFFDTETMPYLKLTNNISGASFYGAGFIGRTYAVMSTNTGLGSAFSGLTGVESFAGFSTGDTVPTKVGGANRGVIIAGGIAFSNGYFTSSPSITVGLTSSEIRMMANKIYMNSNSYFDATGFATVSGLTVNGEATIIGNLKIGWAHYALSMDYGGNLTFNGKSLASSSDVSSVRSIANSAQSRADSAYNFAQTLNNDVWRIKSKLNMN
ncbi:gp58-like family protein [Lacticaseibacillus saniviri]